MNQPAFVKTRTGLYRVRKHLTPEEIVQQAAAILLEGICEGTELCSSEKTADFLQLALGSAINEQFSVLFLNTRHQVLAFEHLFTGTIDNAVIHPRVVVQRALHWNASAVILAHNHPSNDCEPSKADKRITALLKDALGLLDIRVLDHFIVSRTGYTSFMERGLM